MEGKARVKETETRVEGVEGCIKAALPITNKQ